MKCGAVLAVLIWLCGVIEVRAQSPAADIFKENQLAIVHVDRAADRDSPSASGSYGTGFIVSDDGFVVTAKHVLEGYVNPTATPVKVRVGSLDGQEIAADIVPSDSQLDVAVLKLRNPGALGLTKYRTVRRGSARNIVPGSPVFIVGFNLTSNISVAPGSVLTNFGGGPGGNLQWSVQSAGVIFGMSGAPVFDLSGSVIGIVIGGQTGTGGIVYIYPEYLIPNLDNIWKQVPPDPDRADGPAEWNLSNCADDSRSAQAEFLADTSDIHRVDKLIECRNPVAYAIRGSFKFYNEDYFGAEADFRLALRRLPANAKETSILWMDNLASTLIETGKFTEAIEMYKKLSEILTSPTDGPRWGLARAYLYQGLNDPGAYNRAIEVLRGVDPNYRGMTRKGKVQIEMAAALVGRSQLEGPGIRDLTLHSAKTELCRGIAQSQDYWRSILNGTTEYLHASFKEEVRLLGMIGGGHISC